ncbi:MAG: dTMP kinase [Caldilineaceae bacterium]
MGFFITFEGPEGSGKTTQIRLLAEQLIKDGHQVLLTREPGGTTIGNAIREILLNQPHAEMSPRAEALLFNAARAQLVDEVVRPALTQGKIVLSDRYNDSTLAYQGYGRNQNLSDLRGLGDFATAHLTPDLTLFLDIDPVEGLRRKQACDGAEWNRMEAQAVAFHQTVREGYLQLARQEPARWRIVNAAQDVAAIQSEIQRQVANLFSLYVR